MAATMMEEKGRRRDRRRRRASLWGKKGWPLRATAAAMQATMADTMSDDGSDDGDGIGIRKRQEEKEASPESVRKLLKRIPDAQLAFRSCSSIPSSLGLSL